MSEAATAELEKPTVSADIETIKSERDEKRVNSADKIVAAKDIIRSPGQVARTGQIELHTKNGHQMFHGRLGSDDNAPIIGFVRFVSYMNVISNHSLDDDPYADAKLFKIEKLIEETESHFTQAIEYLDGLLREPSRRRPVITSHGSSKPQTYELNIASGYGWKGAELLCDFDQIMQYGLDAQHVRRLDQNGWSKYVASSAKKLRRLFLESAGYKSSGVTREDLRKMTPEAQTVMEERGPLPEDILNSTRVLQHRASFKVNNV